MPDSVRPTPLEDTLFHLARLGVDVDFAFAGVTRVLLSAPPAVPSRLEDADRQSLLADGDVSEQDLVWAEENVSSGRFAEELVRQFLLALTASLFDQAACQLVGVTQPALDKLFAEGHLVGRTSGLSTATPSWMFDTAHPGALLPHITEILSADAPEYGWTFGLALYDARREFRALSPLSPRQWLIEGRAVGPVAAVIESANANG